MNITLGQAVLSAGSASPLVQFTFYYSILYILYRKQCRLNIQIELWIDFLFVEW